MFLQDLIRLCLTPFAFIAFDPIRHSGDPIRVIRVTHSGESGCRPEWLYDPHDVMTLMM